MSIYHKNKGANASKVSVPLLTAALSQIGGGYASESVNMQSLGEAASREIFVRQTTMGDDLINAYGDDVTLNKQQIEAGVRAMVAASNVEEHARLSVSGFESAQEKDQSGFLALRGSGGDISHESVNMQSYESRDFSKFKEASIEFNVLSTAQDAVSELFFPSLNVSADAPLLRSTLRSVVVQRNVQHSKSGAPTNLSRKNLAHAFTNPEILENNSTAVIPVVAADNSNIDNFVPAAKFAPYDVEVDGEANKTAPLVIGREVNLLGLAANGTFAPAEGYDGTDQLNSRAVLNTLLVEVSDGVATSQIQLKVGGLPTSNFVKAIQGNSNEDFILNFTTTNPSFSTETLDKDGVAATALADIEAGISLRLKVKAHGDLNLNTSNLTVDGASVNVIAAYGAAGKVAIEGALETAVNKLTMQVIGYELAETTRTNSNRSTTGLWVDTTSHSREFAIGAQAPIYHPMPRGAETPQDIVQSLVAASRAVTTNRGMAAIINHVNALEAYVAMGATDIQPSDMFPGASDELVPYFKSIELDVKAKLNSISTHEKGEDIRSLFSTVLTHYVAEMINRSNYITALEMARGTAAKPKVIIATDPEIAPWLMLSGDADFLGRMVDYQVTATVHPEFKGRIVVSFGSDTTIDGIDPLGFGRRGWITELLATQDTTRNGKASKEVVIQPRELHAAVLPVALNFDVSNLTEAVNERL